MTRDELNRATLARQLLLERSPVGVVSAVSVLAGLQAQQPKPPFVGLWSRLSGFSVDALRDRLRDGSVVRATLMRATLHLAAADDWPVFRAAMAPALGGALRALGARAPGIDVPSVVAAARDVLADGPLPFSELRPRLQAVFPSLDERALGYAVRLHLPLVLEPPPDRWGSPRVPSFRLARRSRTSRPGRGSAG